MNAEYKEKLTIDETNLIDTTNTLFNKANEIKYILTNIHTLNANTVKKICQTELLCIKELANIIELIQNDLTNKK